MVPITQESIDSKVSKSNMCEDDEDEEEEKQMMPSSSRKLTQNVVTDIEKLDDESNKQQILFHSQMKNEKKPSFSPEVSPINGNILHDTLRDSHMDQNEHAAWMGVDAAGYSNFPGNMSSNDGGGVPAHQQMPL